MIIRCPGCQKRYDITPYMMAQKKHYKLRCASCRTVWQLSAPSTEPKSIESNPARGLPSHESKKQVLPPPRTYSTWHDLIKQYSLDWIILLAAVAIAVLLMVCEGKNICSIPMPAFLTASVAPLQEEVVEFTQPAAMNAVVSPELSVENIAFSTVEQNGRLRFMVKGEIVNQSRATAVSPDLAIIAWGECALDPDDPRRQSLPDKSEPQQRCILVQWTHPLSGQLIESGERHSFQAFAPMPGAIQAKEVEITGYSPH